MLLSFMGMTPEIFQEGLFIKIQDSGLPGIAEAEMSAPGKDFRKR